MFVGGSRRAEGLATLREMLFNGTKVEIELHNVLDWMGDDAVALVREYLEAHPQKADSILGRMMQVHRVQTAK